MTLAPPNGVTGYLLTKPLREFDPMSFTLAAWLAVHNVGFKDQARDDSPAP